MKLKDLIKNGRICCLYLKKGYVIRNSKLQSARSKIATSKNLLYLRLPVELRVPPLMYHVLVPYPIKSEKSEIYKYRYGLHDEAKSLIRV